MSSLKEPVSIVFSEELGGLSKESTESEGQGVGNSSVCFIALHLVFVGSRIRRKSFVEICVVVAVVDFLCSDF